MVVTPKIKASEVIKIASSLFANAPEIKTSSLTIVDEIIEELRYNCKLDWWTLRHTGEETMIYWREVKAEINAFYSA